MITVPTRVAVIVLSWNGREDTLACLEALAADGAGDRDATLEVIVVDNGSRDGTEAAVRAAYPWTTVLQTGANLGFSGGNNVGIEAALERGADFVLVLNNDALVAPGAIDRLVRTAVERPGTGAVSPLILFHDPPDRVWFAGARFDPRRGRSGRVSGYRARLADLPDADTPRETGRAVGAAMLVPRAVVERLGVFDPDLFFLYEDVEWSLRMRAAGLRIWFEPRARVRHRVAASQGGHELTPTTLYYGTRNHLAVCSRHAPLGMSRSVAARAGDRRGPPRRGVPRGTAPRGRRLRRRRLAGLAQGEDG